MYLARVEEIFNVSIEILLFFLDTCKEFWEDLMTCTIL
jgi:hypothetical protein